MRLAHTWHPNTFRTFNLFLLHCIDLYGIIWISISHKVIFELKLYRTSPLPSCSAIFPMICYTEWKRFRITLCMYWYCLNWGKLLNFRARPEADAWKHILFDELDPFRTQYSGKNHKLFPDPFFSTLGTLPQVVCILFSDDLILN